MSLTTALTLEKPEVFESRQIRLTSPLLHIGSAIPRLNRFEYVQTSGQVYLPNQEALAKALLQQGRLSDYIAAISSNQPIVDILEQAFGKDWQTACDAEGHPIFPSHLVSQKWTENRITDLRPMIRNGFGQLYIPGSSIKGAIRTAIAYYLLKHDQQFQVPPPQRVSTIEKKLRERLQSGQLNAFQQKFLDDDWLMNPLFTDFGLTYQGRSIRCSQGPNTDFMRAIHVTDTAPLLERDVRLKTGKARKDNIALAVEVVVSSRFPNYNAKYRAPIYVEMVRNVNTTFTLSIDKTALSWFQHHKGMQLPFQSVDDILRICQEFAQEQWDFEHDYWQTIKNNPNDQGESLDFSDIKGIYEPEACPYGLRLGWGSGMNGVTIGSLLEDDLRAQLRDTCGLKAPGFEAPKSRRTVRGRDGEIQFVPGWVKFTPR